MKPPKVRLNADLSPSVAEALRKLADKQEISVTEALSRAISTEATLLDKRKEGSKVILSKDGKLSELIFTR